MVYKEYLNSARKHLFTCNVIFEWDVDIRYSYDTKKYNDRDYIQFYEYAKKIYETLTIDFGVR